MKKPYVRNEGRAPSDVVDRAINRSEHGVYGTRYDRDDNGHLYKTTVEEGKPSILDDIFLQSKEDTVTITYEKED